MKKCAEIDADYIATGHYAKIEYDYNRQRFLLRKGVDQSKDQSYFLYHINRNNLNRILMPLGYHTKDEVREIASANKLPVAAKAESQEICFIANDDYKSFISRNTTIPLQEGNFVDMEGRIVGRHKGIALYTIGQRKGLGIALGKTVMRIL